MTTFIKPHCMFYLNVNKWKRDEMKKLALLLFAISLSSCNNAVGPNSLTTKIVGLVTDKDSGLALDSATVYIFSERLTGIDGKNLYYSREVLEETPTDENGFYELTLTIKEDEYYNLGAFRDGYIGIYTFSYNAIRVEYKSFQSIDIQLQKF